MPSDSPPDIPPPDTPSPGPLPPDTPLADINLSSLDAKTVALLDGLLEAVDGAGFVCDTEGTIVRSNETSKADFGDGARPGRSIQDLIRAPSPLDVRMAAPGEGQQTVEVEGVVASRSGERKVKIRVRRSGPWRIVVLSEPVQEPDPWGTPLPHETLRTLIETMRDPLASVRAAAETILLYPGMDAAAAAQFMQIIEEQTETLSERLDTAVESYAEFYRQAGPLEPMEASALEEVVRAYLRRHVDISVADGAGVERESDGGGMRVRIDPQALTEAMAFLARRLENATRCTELAVTVRSVRGLAALDLTWEGARLRPDRLREWEGDTLTLRNSLVKMTLAELVDHHDAQLLVQSDPNRIRLLLPTG